MRGQGLAAGARHGGQSCNRSAAFGSGRMSRAMTWVVHSRWSSHLAWPSSSWSTRCSPVLQHMGRKTVAQVWQPTFLSSPACAVGLVSPPFAGRIRARDGASPGPSAGPGSAHGPENTHCQPVSRAAWVFSWQAPRGGYTAPNPSSRSGDGGLSPPRFAPATLPAGFGQDGGSVLTALAARTKMRCWPKSTSWIRRRMHSSRRRHCHRAAAP